MLIRYVIYGLLGWAMEILWTGLHSMLNGDVKLQGTTYLWMLPIYGLAVFLEPLHDRIRHLPWIVRGVIWSIIILALEYITGWMIQGIVGTSPWDYTGTAYSVRGLIRLDYFPVWFVVGLIYEKLHDILRDTVKIDAYKHK